MSNIDKRATELLIENGVLVADTLRHLADNEIDSDYFAICHTNENGTEIECELAITDYARQAAGTVDELVKALEAAEKRNADLEGLLEAEVRLWTQRYDCANSRREVAEKRIADLEELGRGVKQFSEFQISHYGATEDYAKGYIDCQNNYNKVLFAATGKGE